MNQKNAAYLEEIRKKAEEIAQKQDFVIPVENAGEYQNLVHELNVHQIELEIQNEELLYTQIELEKTRDRYADLFNNAPVGYVVLDQSGFIVNSNQTFADMIGRDISKIIGTPLPDYLTKSSQRVFLGHYKTFFKNPVDKQIDVEIRETPENPLALRLYGRKETVADLSDRLRIIVTDITEQKAAEKALRNSHKDLELRSRIAETMLEYDDSEMFRHVLDILLDHFESTYGLFGFIDQEGNLVCPSLTREVFPKCAVENISNVFPQSEWGGMWGESLLQKRTVCKNSDLVLPKGHIHLQNSLAVPILHSGRLVGLIVIGNKPDGYNGNDIWKLENVADWIAPVLSARIERDHQREKRVEAENSLRQAQRLESIGVLAGGIAHDFNNMLSPIIGYADMMMEDMPPDECQQYNIPEIARAARRARDLVSQILAFSRQQMLEIRPVNINRIIRDLSNILNRLIREDVEMTFVLSEEPLRVRGDAGQLGQVLLNLVGNAQDAMPSGGKIIIESIRRHFDVPYTKPGFTVEPGDYCRVRVHDTGEGIPETVLPHIFEPFFTTRDVGKGTGMGLATSYGIVKQHGGQIWAETDSINGGSVFTMLLPLVPLGGTGTQPDNMKTPVFDRSQQQLTVMVVEDEPAVRAMVVLALKKQGFTVLESESPEECLERVNAEGLSIGFLLTDVIMPGCSGKELFQQLKKKMPDLKVLYMSGYTDNVITGKGLQKEENCFIAKPFSIKELTEKIFAILGNQ